MCTWGKSKGQMIGEGESGVRRHPTRPDFRVTSAWPPRRSVHADSAVHGCSCPDSTKQAALPPKMRLLKSWTKMFEGCSSTPPQQRLSSKASAGAWHVLVPAQQGACQLLGRSGQASTPVSTQPPAPCRHASPTAELQ